MIHRTAGERGISRRDFVKGVAGAAAAALVDPADVLHAATGAAAASDLFWITEIPRNPFTLGGNLHAGVSALLEAMGEQGLTFYRSATAGPASGPLGMIAADDVVLVKVNAQWKYRGCTNSDLVRGLIQAVLDHPDGFRGEVVIVENGQGRGSLACDTSQAYGNSEVHANANDRSHSFVYLVESIFADPRVSAFLLDPLRATFIGPDDHATDGYRRWRGLSYPCFTTRGGRRVELKRGIWTGAGFARGLKLLNVPVLKHHDDGGSYITAALKHVYGLLSMADGGSAFRHYAGLGVTCGRMMAAVRTPVLNIVDATWASHGSLRGYPADTTRRRNQILAGQDPVAVDYWAAKHLLYPIDGNPLHHPAQPGIDAWLTAARDAINGLGGLYDPEAGILAGLVTKRERHMRVHTRSLAPAG